MVLSAALCICVCGIQIGKYTCHIVIPTILIPLCLLYFKSIQIPKTQTQRAVDCIITRHNIIRTARCTKCKHFLQQYTIFIIGSWLIAQSHLSMPSLMTEGTFFFFCPFCASDLVIVSYIMSLHPYYWYDSLHLFRNVHTLALIMIVTKNRKTE